MSTESVSGYSILLWINVPRADAPNVDDPIEHEGIDYRVTRVVRSKAKRGTVNIEAWPDGLVGEDPTSVLLVCGFVPARTGELLAVL